MGLSSQGQAMDEEKEIAKECQKALLPKINQFENIINPPIALSELVKPNIPFKGWGTLEARKFAIPFINPKDIYLLSKF